MAHPKGGAKPLQGNSLGMIRMMPPVLKTTKSSKTEKCYTL